MNAQVRKNVSFNNTAADSDINGQLFLCITVAAKEWTCIHLIHWYCMQYVEDRKDWQTHVSIVHASDFY